MIVMDNKRPQAAECTPGQDAQSHKTWQEHDRCWIQVSLSSVAQVSCPVLGVRSGSPGGRTVSLSVSHLYSGTLPLGNPISRPFVLNTLLAFTYFPSILPILSKPVSPSKFSSESSARRTPPRVMDPVLFTEYWTTWGVRTASCFCFCFLRPQHKASCSSHSRTFGWVN